MRPAAGRELETRYAINLDPERLRGEPAVIRSRFGEGTVLLSLVHFDSPDDANGATVLANIWKELLPACAPATVRKKTAQPEKTTSLAAARPALAALAEEMKQSVDGLIDLGVRNFLWFPRNSVILQWRRGVRGLEYCTLKVLMDEIAGIVAARPGCPAATHDGKDTGRIAALAAESLAAAAEWLFPFIDEARTLLVLERQAMTTERLTFDESSDPAIRAIRAKLFSGAKSHGGMFEKAIDAWILSLQPDLRKKIRTGVVSAAPSPSLVLFGFTLLTLRRTYVFSPLDEKQRRLSFWGLPPC